MFCPQCGLESQAELKYCRSCGANLKVIGKAVTLSEAIARSDGVPAKIKEMVQNLKVEKVTDEVSRAMEKMNQEIARSTAEHRQKSRRRKEKTPAERRESLLTKGLIKMGWGSGFALFLYFLSHSIVLKLDPDAINKIPFEVESIVRVIWLIGLVPVLSGIGHLVAGLTIRPAPANESEPVEGAPLRIETPEVPANFAQSTTSEIPPSVTERTTNILDRDLGTRSSQTS
jgi:hypothetical protein